MLTVTAGADGKSVDCHQIYTVYALVPPLNVRVVVTDPETKGRVVKALNVHPSVVYQGSVDCV